MLTKFIDVILQCLWRHSYQFKPKNFSRIFWVALVPPLWKRLRHPCTR